MSNIVQIHVATAGTVPASGTDYQRQNDLLLTRSLFQGLPYPLDLTNNKVVKGAIFQVGGVTYKASADETITGSASDYVKLTPISAGDQLSAAYVANLSGVSWSDTYNGYVDVSGNLYVFDEAKAFLGGAVSIPKTIPGILARTMNHGRRTFTSSGTFTVPFGVSEVWITGCAAGGNGGTAVGASGGNGGAKGQRVIKKRIAVTPGASITVTIGAVGANTTFGGLLTLAFGVTGGAIFNAGTSGGNGAASQTGGRGGEESPLDGSVAGSNGSSGTGSGPAGGAGGAGYPGGGGGGGGAAGGAGNGGAGGAANGYGAGGGGQGAGGTPGAVGAGGPAILTVEW